MRLSDAKRAFFDAPQVLAATTAAERRVLSRFGAYVRQRARTSIRSRAGTSTPGMPPFSHTGLLKRFLFFAYDTSRRSVVIGPVRLDGRTGEALPLLEHGGTTQRPRPGRVDPSTYTPRPFMRPAFQRELSKLPPLWRDSIR